MPTEIKGIILEQIEWILRLSPEKGIPEAMVPQIEQATEPIIAVIRKYVTNAFNDVFPWVAITTGIGIIPALFIRRSQKTPDISPG